MMKLPHRSLALPSAGVICALVLAACGGAGGTTERSAAGDPAEVAAAEKVVEAAKQAVTEWPGPVDAVTPTTDTHLGILSCNEAGSGCSAAAAGAKEAAEELGWKVTLVDGRGDPSVISHGLEQLLQADVDAVVMTATDYTLVKSGLAKAEASQIPVACIICVNPDGVGTIEVGTDEHRAGVSVANYMIAESGGTAQVGLLEDKNYASVRARMGGVRETIEDCSGCRIVETRGIASEPIDQQGYDGAQSLLRSFPKGKLDYIALSYDLSAVSVARAIKDLGRSDVKIIGYDATPAGLDLVHQGIEVANNATPLQWAGWQAVDQILRSFADQPLYDGATQMPAKLITKDNAPAPGERFTGDLDFRSEYRRLWGV